MTTFATPFLAAVPPLTPDDEQARQWAENELSQPKYQAAEPTWFDRLSTAVFDFFNNLFSGDGDSDAALIIAVVGAVIVAVLIILSLTVWGRPRPLARGRKTEFALFGELEHRTANELRAAAAEHASRSQWDLAIVLRFRAMARHLDDTDLIALTPGVTAHAFVRLAAGTLPASSERLERAAVIFDEVRYLRGVGTESMYQDVAEVDALITAQQVTGKHATGHRAGARPAAEQHASAQHAAGKQR